MKDIINYYYNLNIQEVENLNDEYRFSLNGEYYYFLIAKQNEASLRDIFNLTQELKTKGYIVHDIIFNRFQKIITPASSTNYILLHPNRHFENEIDLNMMFRFNQDLVLNANQQKLYRNRWPYLWSQKIDYFEYQIHELGKDKNIVLDSFSYYVGLAENAISYANSTITKYEPTPLDKVCLSHKRIKFPNYELNYANPLSFIFDLEVRDFAEYLKSAFFANEDSISYLKTILRGHPFSIYSLQLLYARLLYPTYYFDLYEKVMNEEDDEEILTPIIEKSSAYEHFLKSAHEEISKYALIEPLSWLNKKEAIN